VDRSLGYLFFESITSVLSPVEFNPLNINPLRDILEELVDFEELRNASAIKLFLSATNARTGRIRIFPTPEVTVDVVLASACLPYLFQSVQIGKEFYWDGGYSGNPAIFPLFYQTKSRDILIIHTNPIERQEIPRTADEIHNRVTEITFNSSLIKEIRAITFVQKLLREGWLKEEYREYFKDVLMHSIRGDDAMCELSVPSKFNTDWDFLMYLFTKGRATAEAWIQKNYQHLGKSSTVDLYQEFLHSDDHSD
jgi:NTE family protein